jgi:hypothetical protein
MFIFGPVTVVTPRAKLAQLEMDLETAETTMHIAPPLVRKDRSAAINFGGYGTPRCLLDRHKPL